jgi:hypothetical protein
MTIANGNIIRAAARQLLDDTDEIVNVFHFSVLTVGTNGDAGVLDEIAARLSNAWLNIQSATPNNVKPNVIDFYNVTQDNPHGQTPWEGAYTGGSGTGNMLPSGVASLVIWTTLEKRVQGKTYLGPMVSAALQDGRWDPAHITNVANWCTAMRDTVSLVDDTELDLVIYSRTQGFPFAISGRRVPANPAYQRRRKVGHGS